jgi:hypothetical protein|tara:strand:- start:199 stop:504 length:306 start_codon:yes stop_codon:yes gene_type:complete
MFAACKSFASDTPDVASRLIPKTVRPFVKLELLAKAAVTKFDELSPTLPTAVYETVQVVDEVAVVDVVEVAVESVLVEQLNAKKAVKVQPARILSEVLFFI